MGGLALAIFDGMSGHPVGEVASQTAADVLADWSSRLPAEPPTDSVMELSVDELLITMRQQMAQIVQASGNAKLIEMATTMVALVVIEGQVWLFNLGDSRAYFLGGSSALRQMMEITPLRRGRTGKNGGAFPGSSPPTRMWLTTRLMFGRSG